MMPSAVVDVTGSLFPLLTIANSTCMGARTTATASANGQVKRCVAGSPPATALIAKATTGHRGLEPHRHRPGVGSLLSVEGDDGVGNADGRVAGASASDAQGVAKL